MPAASSSLTGGIAAGIARAKGDWLLILEPGARLLEGWIEPVAMHIAKSTMPARFSRARSERLPFLARVFSANRALAAGPGDRQAAGVPAGQERAATAEALARGLAVKQLAGGDRPGGAEEGVSLRPSCRPSASDARRAAA